MRNFVLLLAVLTCAFATNFAVAAKPSRQQFKDGRVKNSGLVIPLDDHSMYLRSPEGQFEVRWNAKTQVALQVNTRQFRNIAGRVLKYTVHSSKQTIDFPLPDGPVTGIKSVRGIDRELRTAKEEKWISAFGLVLRFGEQLPHQLPSKAEPRFVGSYEFPNGPNQLRINDATYEVSLKKGGQTDALLFGVVGLSAVKPFVTRATVIGKLDGDVIIADEIHVVPIGDTTANDDPKLPRYLFIGDSISGNYDKGLREALASKTNLHHPPTNCGPSGKGRAQIVNWLGAYDQPRRHWDVISFNFGHWDAGNTKVKYQENLEAVIGELKKTKAKLVWVTTCPVPRGFPRSGGLTQEGNAPRRTSGVMEEFLNPWALEVMKRHPEISVCDHWQFVADHENNLFKSWWPGANVHFGSKTGAALGQYLAEHVAKALSEN